MNTKENILIQLFKNKLTTNDPNAVLVINLKRPIILPYYKEGSELGIKITLISYEKETDTVWLLGKDSKDQFVKVSMETAISQGLPTILRLKALAKELNKIQTPILEIQQKTISN